MTNTESFAVLDSNGHTVSTFATREEARSEARELGQGYRIAELDANGNEIMDFRTSRRGR